MTAPFRFVILGFCDLFQSYGWAILACGLIIKLILLPFQMRAKRATMQTTMLQPRQKELEKKYANNKQKYQEELAALYKNAKVNPLSGCIWSLLPYPILIAMYSVVRQPLSKLMLLTADQITTLTDLLTNMGLYTAPTRASAYTEMRLAGILHEHFSEIIARPEVTGLLSRLRDIDFSFLGLNLTEQPHFFFWNYIDQQGFWPAFILFLIPFISAGLTILQTKVAMKMQPTQDDAAAQTARTMNMWMPIMSLYICFIMPAAMGIYWVEQSILAIIQDALLNRFYQKKLDAEMAEFNEAERLREEELERKRQETERLRSEGKTQVNASTSKKRLAAKERNDEEQRQAVARAAERAAARAARGEEENIPASQVGKRRYARGRAYDPDRYWNEAIEPSAAMEASAESADGADEAASEQTEG